MKLFVSFVESCLALVVIKTRLKSAGLERLIEYSQKHDDHELYNYLISKPQVVKVHNSCRRDFISKRRYEQKCSKVAGDDSPVKAKSLRSAMQSFVWKIHCFLCVVSRVLWMSHILVAWMYDVWKLLKSELVH